MDNRKKDRIAKYLLENSCKPSLKGFDILVELIFLSIENPDFNKTRLFEEYVRLKDDKVNDKAAYRSVKYCLDNSLCLEKRVYPMIKTAAIQLREEL